VTGPGIALGSAVMAEIDTPVVFADIEQRAEEHTEVCR
jgi:hypothetical protein